MVLIKHGHSLKHTHQLIPPADWTWPLSPLANSRGVGIRTRVSLSSPVGSSSKSASGEWAQMRPQNRTGPLA